MAADTKKLVSKWSPEDQLAYERFKTDWGVAHQNGDEPGMEAAHEGAELLWNKYGYMVDADGTNPRPHSSITPAAPAAATGGAKPTGGTQQTAQKQTVTPAVPAVEPFSFGSRPSYQSDYGARIDAMLNQLLTRQPFSYDPAADPIYRQYEQMYTRNGQQAMEDTLAQLSARTGGLASSYAGAAAQQTYDAHMAELSDKVPELRALAYEMYLNDEDRQMQQLGLLRDLDATQYSRQRDAMGDWEKDRDFAYSAHRDSIADRRYNTEWQHQLGRDAADDEWRKTQWEHQLELEDKQAEEDRNAMLLEALLEGGIVNDSTKGAYEHYFGESWPEEVEEEAVGGAYEPGAPYFDFDQDEGIFTFNGSAYNSLPDLQAAIERTPMTDAEFEALLKKLKQHGIPVTAIE